MTKAEFKNALGWWASALGPALVFLAASIIFALTMTALEKQQAACRPSIVVKVQVP